MNGHLACLFALAALLPAVAHADDGAAKAHMRKAFGHWRDADPSTTAKYLALAVKEAQSKGVKAKALLWHGIFHQGKTGNFEQALSSYESLIKLTEGATSRPLKWHRAQGFLNKGSILFTKSGDVKKALPHYRASFKLFPTALSADYLSQALYRVGRDPNTPAAEAKKAMATSLERARQAVKLDSKARRRRPANTAKLRLQLVIVLTAQGNKTEADEVWKATERNHFSANTLYQEAILLAVQKAGAEKIGAKLRKSLDPKVRPKARARNQLRKMIRSEPDFRDHLKLSGWKDLVTDEKVKQPKPTSRPSK